jgi:hypothetical protein
LRRRSKRVELPAGVKYAALLLLLSLTSCSRSQPPPPVFSPWSEQVAAAERAVQEKGGDLMLVNAGALPLRDKPSSRDEPIELGVYIFFASPKASQQADENKPRYDALMVKYNDYHLATTFRSEDARRAIEDDKNPAGLRVVRVGPQDVLKTTRAEGEAYMGEPVNRGNILLNLLRVSDIPSDIKSQAVWRISYLREKGSLDFWVDAQTGEILKRSTIEK